MMNYRNIRHISIIILLFIILGFGIYSNTLKSPFFFDDTKRIRDNPDIRLKYHMSQKQTGIGEVRIGRP